MVDVSYIIPTYNKAWVIDKVWQALQQQQGNFSREFIFCDDVSDDNTVQKLQEITHGHDGVKIIKQTQNLGPSLNLNSAVHHAEGKWLHIVDGDDRLCANATQIMMHNALEYNANLVYGRIDHLDLDKTPPLLQPLSIIESHDDHLLFAITHKITHIALLVKKDLFENAGGANPNIFIQDQSLAWRLAHHSEKMLLLDTPCVYTPPKHIGKRLSVNTAQQHHDVVLAAYDMMQYDISLKARQELSHRIIALLWKYQRDKGKIAIFSVAFWRYISHRLSMKIYHDDVYHKIINDIALWPDIHQKPTIGTFQ